jgi:radical SAM superfamily enzyme YgiQ (UPF0313 family)
MELPPRKCGDELLQPGEFTRVRNSLRKLAALHDLRTVIAYAFDPRTQMLPFLYADVVMAPAGVRAIGAAMVDSGFPKTRIVLQQWNRRFLPSQMRLEGQIPDLFMVSSMELHSAECDAMIQDACRIDPGRRPLIIAGGPRVIYEPWRVFSADHSNPWGADVAVTGEEYVLLSLLEVLLSVRAGNEPMRSAFQRARDSGALEGIPGLVYAKTDAKGVPEQLVDTGVQRLLRDFDELPHAALAFRLLEPPSHLATLGRTAIPAGQVRKHTRLASLVMTQGCRLACPYCPIPAYNQRKLRGKSGARIVDEVERIFNEYDIRLFFGTDDNFFADRERALDITEALARKVEASSRPHCKIRWATEATIQDTLKMQEHLSTARKAGLWALWLGVEDMSGGLVKKGQNENRTVEAFQLLRRNGIFPVPMLMHHDAQPLFSWRGNHGLLNQLAALRKAGALYMQVLMLTPSPGAKSYEHAYTSELAYISANGVPVVPSMKSGMHVIASRHPRPWIKQLNLLAAYLFFFNPLRLLFALIWPKSPIPLADAETWPPAVIGLRPKRREFKRWLSRKLRAHFGDAAIQAFGILGLLPTFRRTLSWTYHLMRGSPQRHTAAPASQIPFCGLNGASAEHALPGPRPSNTSECPGNDSVRKAA